MTAEVFAPNQKKPFLRVDGEWNGKMIAKWLHTGRNEVFVDVTRIKIHEKLCKKVAEQGRFESRRLWRDVTYGLKFGNIEGKQNFFIFYFETEKKKLSVRLLGYY